MISLLLFNFGLISIKGKQKRDAPKAILHGFQDNPIVLSHCCGYTPLRPVTKLITKTIAAMIKRMCISPPATSIKNPISHTTIITAKIIQRMRPMIFTCPFKYH